MLPCQLLSRKCKDCLHSHGLTKVIYYIFWNML